MKKRFLLISMLITFILISTSSIFAQSHDQLKTDALTYIQNTDLSDLFTQKDEDSPFELNLPDNVRDNLAEMAINEALYQKVGINLQEEVKDGNLYIEDGMYYIKFKEKKIKKEIIKSQKKLYGMNIKEVSLKEALQVDELNLDDYELTDIIDLKFLINLRTLFLSDNKKITNYTILSHLKILRGLFLEENRLEDISFLKYVPSTLDALSLQKNHIDDISILSRFTELKTLMLSDNDISSLEAINSSKIEYLELDGNPISIQQLEHIKKLCFSGVLFELYIDRAVFKEYGDYFALYPEYLQWIGYIYFVEDDGSVTEWRNY